MKENYSLKRSNTWHIGGCARYYYNPDSAENLSTMLKQLDADTELFCLGLGSNVLIHDSGFTGTVIHLSKQLGGITSYNAAGGAVLRVEAGLPCPQFARQTMQRNLIGAEFFAGIPGTIGGALAMNAGAFGGETWGIVTAVETLDRTGVWHKRLPAEYEVGYRSVKSINDEIIIAGHFLLKPGDSSSSKQKIKELLQKRKQTQPIGKLSCGSVFKNPVNDYAARLITEVKLKGERIGDAEISTKHANFILNVGKASSDDVAALITLAQKRVYEFSGILLEPEVKFIGMEVPCYSV